MDRQPREREHTAALRQIVDWDNHTHDGENDGTCPTCYARGILESDVCLIEGCDKPLYNRGWCASHYSRWKRHGDPNQPDLRVCRDPYERFMGKVQVNDDGCWLWTGKLNNSGYGSFGVGARGTGVRGAHRWSYEYHVGPIPKGLQIDHLCRVRNCVNPGHLEPVTAAENNRRAHASIERNRDPSGRFIESSS